ncbi:MAG: leucine--tRNA ligase [Deltaproteobacteria bacterium]
MQYNPHNLEKKWRAYWEENQINKTLSETNKPKYYCLDMFPYPSGEGLHVGHWRGYVLSDVWSRYKRLQGYNVLHPMGWDAFGLPAENAAIKKNIHPKINTQSNVSNMKRQLKEIGAMYDWSREINTTDPEYYKWTQWIFVQMHKRGLAYRKKMPINWCPSCKTGLANEEVVDGKCDRCSSEVEKREMLQWMLKITAYADRLIDDLDKLNWPEKVKIMQKNWIGRSEGAEVIFKIKAENGSQYDLPVFTTRPDTLFGATYVVMAPEHQLVDKITSKESKNSVDEYVSHAKAMSEIERTDAAKDKTGAFTGAYAVNPVNGKEIPVWVSDYVLAHYGSGAIMAVPAHDQRDFDFAKKFGIEIIEVISSGNAKKDEKGQLIEAYTEDGTLINSGDFDGMDYAKAKSEIVEWLAKKGLGKKTIAYKLRDWVFARQRYWGEPIPIIYCDKCGEVAVDEKDLPVLLPEVENYKPSGTGKSPLAVIPEFVHTTCPKCGGPAERETDTMPQWAGSSWYFLRYINPRLETAAFDKKDANTWLPVDCYVGGIEHAVLHLLYARFFTKVLFDCGYIDFDEPFDRLFNQGMVCKYSEKSGKLEKMSKSKGNVVNPDPLVEKYGTDTVRLYELFIGAPEMDSEWTDSGIEGCFRFLKKSWDWIVDSSKSYSAQDSKEVVTKLHGLIFKVVSRLESFKFNTAISAFMEFINFVSKAEVKKLGVTKDTIEKFMIILAPFAPHMCEELWQLTGHKGTIFEAKLPEYDEALIDEEIIEIAIQVNGKLRGTIKIEKDAEENKVAEDALKEVERSVNPDNVVKTIYVPNKIINFIVRG